MLSSVRKHTVFYVLMAGFLLVTFVCSFFILLQNLVSSRRTMKQTTDTYGILAEKVFQSTDDYISRYQLAVDQILQTEGLEKVVSEKTFDFGSEESYTFWTCLNNQFNWYLSANGNVCFVYLKESDTALSVHGLWTGTDAYKSGEIVEILGLDDITWQNLIHTDETLHLEIQQTEQMDFQRLFISKEIFPGLVFLTGLADTSLTDQLEYSYLPEDSGILLITQNDQTIISSGSEMPVKFSFSENSPNAKISNAAAEDGSDSSASKPVITSTPAENGGVIDLEHSPFFFYSRYLLDQNFREIILIPDTIHAAYYASLIRTCLFVILIWLILGGLISYLLAKKLYQPVEELLNSLPLSTEERRLTSEFKQIRNAFSRLTHQNRAVQGQLDAQAELLAASLMNRLVSGSVSATPEVLTALQQADVPLESGSYLLVRISVISSGLKESLDVDASVFGEYPFTTRFAEHFRQHGFDSYFAPRGAFDYIGLVSADASREEEVYQVISELTGMLPGNSPLVMYIAASDFFQNLDSLALAGNQCRKLLDLLLLYETEGGIAFFNRFRNNQTLLSDNRPVSSLGFLEEVHLLTGMIVTQDFQQVIQLLPQLFDEIRQLSLTDYEQASDQLEYLLHALQLSVQNLPGISKERIAEACELGPYPLSDARNIEKRLTAFLQEVQEHIVGSSSETRQRIERIQRYVCEHYAEDALSATSVAEQFDLSLTWMSVTFKKETGIGFLDYLHSVRIGHAKELLNTTNLPIPEIAERTGYTNQTTLYRAFKRYEGVTPGWYRKNQVG